MPTADEKALRDFEMAQNVWENHRSTCPQCRRAYMLEGTYCEPGKALKKEMLRTYRLIATIEE